MSLFGTAGIRGSTETAVTPALGVELGVAFGRDADSVVVGRDGRVTGSGLADAVASGLQSAGSEVIRVGQVPTPALAYASQGQRGVMVTASHNPPGDNGFKCFVDGAEIDEQTEVLLSERITSGTEPASWTVWGQSRAEEILPTYRSEAVSFLRDLFGQRPLEGLRIAIDCGGGMGGLATPHILDSLGAHTVSLDANIDGSFSSRSSKPTAESLQSFLEFVRISGVDLGIAHDGDGDRLVIVDESGICHEDTILAVVAREYVQRATQSNPIVVTTPNVSARVEQVVLEEGGTVEYAPLGGLISSVTGRSGQPVVFAAEPWKHVHPSFGPWMDAIVSAGVIGGLVARSGSLEALCKDIPTYPYRKGDVHCLEERKSAAMETVKEELARRFPAADIDDAYGVRLTVDDVSWILLRPSGTEPYIRVYGEGPILARWDDVLELVEAAVGADSEN